jgi:hypothetical protein
MCRNVRRSREGLTHAALTGTHVTRPACDDLAPAPMVDYSNLTVRFADDTCAAGAMLMLLHKQPNPSKYPTS